MPKIGRDRQALRNHLKHRLPISSGLPKITLKHALEFGHEKFGNRSCFEDAGFDRSHPHRPIAQQTFKICNANGRTLASLENDLFPSSLDPRIRASSFPAIDFSISITVEAIERQVIRKMLWHLGSLKIAVPIPVQLGKMKFWQPRLFRPVPFRSS